MTQLRGPLKSVRIAAPCPSSWAAMAGDERVRHCTSCSLNVYNFAEMTADEVRTLLLRTEGRLCARIYRRSDGTMITRDCPTGLRAIGRRVSRAAGAVLTALLAFTGCAAGSRSCAKPSTLDVEFADAPEMNGALVGRATDVNDLPIPGVRVSLTNEMTKQIRTVISNVDGEFSLARVPPGTYTVAAELDGFVTARREHLGLDGSRTTRVRATLDVDTITVTMGMAATRESRPGEMTFSADRLRNIPF